MNNNLKVVISKMFPQPVEKVYAAWTDCEQLKKWWKPMDNTLTDVVNDLKQGGEVKYIFENGLIISGNYEEVIANNKLCYTWNWKFPKNEVIDANFILTVIFMEENEGSTINITQSNFEDEESMLPHKEGWEKGLSDLAKYLLQNN